MKEKCFLDIDDIFNRASVIRIYLYCISDYQGQPGEIWLWACWQDYKGSFESQVGGKLYKNSEDTISDAGWATPSSMLSISMAMLQARRVAEARLSCWRSWKDQKDWAKEGRTSLEETSTLWRIRETGRWVEKSRSGRRRWSRRLFSHILENTSYM